MSKVFDTLKSNWGLKLVSLVLAIVLEIYFYSPDNSVTSVLRARVDFVGLPPNYVVTEPRGDNGPYLAEVHVRGPRTLIDQLLSANRRFRVPVPPGKVTQFAAALDVRQLSLPSGVEALRITPERVTVKIEREVKKELLVVLDRKGTVPEGYRIESVSLFPDSVVVRGPLSKMDGLQAVETVTVDVDGLIEPIESEVSLKDLGPDVTSSVTMVRARVEISEVPQQKLFENVPVQLIAPKGFAASIEQPKASVVLAGPKLVLDGLDVTSLHLRADARNLSNGSHELSLTAELPDGVTILSTEPAKVRVRLTASRTSGSKSSK